MAVKILPGRINSSQPNTPLPMAAAYGPVIGFNAGAGKFELVSKYATPELHSSLFTVPVTKGYAGRTSDGLLAAGLGLNRYPSVVYPSIISATITPLSTATTGRIISRYVGGGTSTSYAGGFYLGQVNATFVFYYVDAITGALTWTLPVTPVVNSTITISIEVTPTALNCWVNGILMGSQSWTMPSSEGVFLVGVNQAYILGLGPGQANSAFTGVVHAISQVQSGSAKSISLNHWQVFLKDSITILPSSSAPSANIASSGSAAATGWANLGIGINVASSGSITATGSANVITASGAAIVTSGVSTATGSANITVGIALSASGSVAATGLANIGTFVSLSASGLSVATGSANLIGYTAPAIVSSGSVFATGAANILPASANAIVSSGAATAAGTANINVKVNFSATTGNVLATGSANLIGYTNVSIIASGSSAATGAANVTTAASFAISASGSATATGSANFGIVVGFNSTGTAIATGTANLTTSGGLVYFSALGSAAFTGATAMVQSVKFSASGNVIASGIASFDHDTASFKQWLIARPARNRLVVESASNRIIVDR